MKSFLFLFLFLIPFYGAHSQTVSVRHNINKDYQSALRLFEDRNYDEALAVVKIGFEKAQKLQDKNQIAFGYFYQARYYEQLGPYTKSVTLYNKALTIF
ncbi:hypothetical protein, partial [Winogradskyella sp. UBA3174]